MNVSIRQELDFLSPPFVARKSAFFRRAKDDKNGQDDPKAVSGK